MDSLLEIVKVISKNRLKKIESLHDESFNVSKSNYSKIYHLLKDGKVLTDQDIAKRINTSLKSNKYRIFKSRFKERLINSLFFLDIRKKVFSESLKAEYLCSRNKHIINTLFLLGARNAASDIAAKTLAIAVKFELAEIASYCSKILRSQSSSLGNLKEFDYYNDLITKYSAVQLAEDTASGMVEYIFLNYANSVSVKPALNELAYNYASKINDLKKSNNSYRLNLYYYRLLAMSYQIKFEHKTALKIWNEFDNYLQSQPKHFNINLRIAESTLNQLGCYFQLKDYLSGQICAEKCKMLYASGTNNWFYFMEYYYLLAMHCKEYSNAIRILKEVITQPRFIHLPDNRKEKWVIFQAYLILISESFVDIKNQILILEEEKKSYKKLFKQKPVLYSKDKRGYNIHILILQTIHFINKGDFSAATDRIDALKRYVTRHLKVDYAYRSYLFMRMLIEAGKSSYNYKLTIEATKKLLQNLNNTNVVFFDSLEIIEIIPYENLWEIFVNKLK